MEWRLLLQTLHTEIRVGKNGWENRHALSIIETQDTHESQTESRRTVQVPKPCRWNYLDQLKSPFFNSSFISGANQEDLPLDSLTVMSGQVSFWQDSCANFLAHMEGKLSRNMRLQRLLHYPSGCCKPALAHSNSPEYFSGPLLVNMNSHCAFCMSFPIFFFMTQNTWKEFLLYPKAGNSISFRILNIMSSC